MQRFFSEAAQKELDDAFCWLEQEQAGLGYRFTADVDEALKRIRQQPHAWHQLGATLRRFLLKHFRYGLIYRGEQIEVLAVAHTSRQPDYWLNRA
jgi:plasmid stabilization system protein ParE